jgi:hypothetical protein
LETDFFDELEQPARATADTVTTAIASRVAVGVLMSILRREGAREAAVGVADGTDQFGRPDRRSLRSVR